MALGILELLYSQAIALPLLCQKKIKMEDLNGTDSSHIHEYVFVFFQL
jgi:hypothetical protein